MDEHGAVGLKKKKPCREGQMRGESPGVIDGTPGNDKTHPMSLGAVGRVGEGVGGGWRGLRLAGRARHEDSDSAQHEGHE